MSALTADRRTKRLARPEGFLFWAKAAASKTFYNGGLVVLNTAGYAEDATDTASYLIAGMAEEHLVSGSTAGDDDVTVRRGHVAAFENAATNAVTQAHVGKLCYVADDQTVKSANGQVKAGTVVRIDDDGVWVHVGVFPAA